MTEKFSDGFQTTTTSAITSGVRPVVFSVAATDATLSGGSFSIIIFDVGTDANPTHAEILQVVDGSTTSWTASTEPTHTATTHASGSTVKQILTRRSLTQPMVDHTTLGTTPDPHTGYLRKTTFTTKGDVLVGTGSGTFTREAVGADGTTIIADSTQVTGRRWGTSGLTLLTHMGDLVVAGLLGLAARLGIGTVGQILAVVQNSSVITSPGSGPSCSAGPGGGSLVNGTSYDFAFAWSNGASPDGGITLPSPRTTFVATSSGSVSVQAPAAPVAGLTLLVYAGTLAGTLYQSATTLPNASTSTPNIITLNSLPPGTQPQPNVANTTGGLSAAWSTPTTTGVTSVALTAPAEYGVSGSPITGSGTIVLTKTQSATAPALATAGTITTAGIGEARVAPTTAVTGVILQSGTYGGQEVWVVNESVAANTITFAAAGTSHVADGASSVIPGLTGRKYVWDSVTSLWSSQSSGSGSVISVALTVPSEFNVAGSPVTSSGTLAVTKVTQSPNTVFAGPASGGAATPAFRAVAVADLPVMVGSGASHAAGVVPDPGATPGATRFLREDATFAIPAGSGGSSGGGSGSGALVPIQVIGPLTASQATLPFSSIPATGFRNLVLKWNLRGTNASAAVTLLGRFNGDTGANYDWAEMSGHSTGPLGSGNVAQTSAQFGQISGNSAPAGQSSAGVVNIIDYLSTTYRKSGTSAYNLQLADSNTNVYSVQDSFTWRNTSSISSIILSLSAGNFDIGSYVCLYGEIDTAGALLTPASNLLYDSGSLPVATTTLNTGTLSQSYRDLRIELVTRGDTAATSVQVLAQFNGDGVAGNYESAAWHSASTSPLAEAISSATTGIIGVVNAASSPASSFSKLDASIGDYTGAQHKSWHAGNGLQISTSTSDLRNVEANGRWKSTAVITSISLTMSIGNFAAGSILRVYGEPASAGAASVGTGTRLRLSGNQSITTATATAIAWDTEDNDADNQHYTSVANLTGTVSKTAASATVTGSGTSFTTELSVGQLISVPGTAAEKRVVIGIASNTSLTVNTPFVNTAAAQTATRVNTAIVFRQPGFFTLEANIYSAALASGAVQLQFYLNNLTTVTSGTPIGQRDPVAINASAGYDLVAVRQFQQWDFVEVVWTQNSGGSVNVLADERTHWSISARPTVIVAVPYVKIQDQKAAPSDGGGVTAGAWLTRVLNTIESDTSGIASLLANQVTLPAGTYRCRASSPAYRVTTHAIRLRNITDSTTLLRGTTEFIANAPSVAQSRSQLSGRFVLTASKVLEIQHYFNTAQTVNGFGVGSTSGGALDGSPDVYTVVEFWKEG